MKTLLIGFILLFLSWGLGACGSGFQLRGSEPLRTDLTVALQGDRQQVELINLVRQALQARGISVSDSQDATVIIELGTLAETRRVTGYSSTRAVSGLRYTAELPFILKPRGATLGKAQQVAQSQTQTYDSAYVLGTQEEADQIKSNLRRELARLLVLKVVAFKP